MVVSCKITGQKKMAYGADGGALLWSWVPRNDWIQRCKYMSIIQDHGYTERIVLVQSERMEEKDKWNKKEVGNDIPETHRH